MRIRLGSVLVCLLVSCARSETRVSGHVSFWQKSFTMTCPWSGTWSKGTTNDVLEHNKKEYKVEYNDTTKGHYRCISHEETYHFYVKGKVCDNCYELDAVTVAVAIVGDVLLTLGVILLVYVRARKRKPARATPKKVSSSGPSGGPAASSSDYETLNANSRSDPYSTVHRMG